MREGVYRAKVEKPEKGFTAGFLEVVFDYGGPAPLTFSTGVRVMPDVLPFAAAAARTAGSAVAALTRH